MTSIKKSPAERDRAIKKFFDDYLVPAAEKLRERGVSFFAQQPDPAARSYFKPYRSEEVAIEIETASVSSLLKELWEQEQLPELVSLVEPLLELAAAVADESPPDEVSPFIYVMF